MTDDDLNRLVGLLDDVVDGLESFQAAHADPFVEGQLGDLRYVRDCLAKLIEQSAPIDEQPPARHPKEQTT